MRVSVAALDRVDRESRTLRTTSLTLTVMLSLVNGWSAMPGWGWGWGWYTMAVRCWEPARRSG
jgi:hypothetical protein